MSVSLDFKSRLNTGTSAATHANLMRFLRSLKDDSTRYLKQFKYVTQSDPVDELIPSAGVSLAGMCIAPGLVLLTLSPVGDASLLQ